MNSPVSDNTINPNETAKGFMRFTNTLKERGNALANTVDAEKNKLQGELTQDLAEQKEKANTRFSAINQGISEQREKAKEMIAEQKQRAEEFKANNQDLIDREGLHGRLKQGTEGLQEGVGNAYQKTVDGYKAAGEAKDVATNAAKEAHAKTLAATVEPQQVIQTQQDGAGRRRRRRRKSRKKKKKSKRKSRRKKKRKRKSRKSRKKRRKKSKKSRRRRRR